MLHIHNDPHDHKITMMVTKLKQKFLIGHYWILNARSALPDTYQKMPNNQSITTN